MMLAGATLLYRWIRRQRHPWRMYVLSHAALAGLIGFMGSQIRLGHGNALGWQIGLILAAMSGFIVLVIWASRGGRWS